MPASSSLRSPAHTHLSDRPQKLQSGERLRIFPYHRSHIAFPIASAVAFPVASVVASAVAVPITIVLPVRSLEVITRLPVVSNNRMLV